MRHRLFIPAATALLFALAACTQDELADGSRLSKEEYPIVIHATGLSVEATPQAAPSTRASVDGDWQGVNSVALKMGDVVKEYIVTTSDADGYKSATLSRENDPYYWTSRDPITVSAWWPLDNTDITQMPVVKVAEDQSNLADFQNSDYTAAENALDDLPCAPENYELLDMDDFLPAEAAKMKPTIQRIRRPK